MTKNELMERLHSFTLLKSGWDSYSASPIHPQAIILALTIIPILDDKEDWFVAPCSDGNILFENGDSTKFIDVNYLPKDL